MAEGLADPTNRVLALRSVGAAVAELPRELQRRLSVLAESLPQPADRARALAALGSQEVRDDLQVCLNGLR